MQYDHFELEVRDGTATLALIGPGGTPAADLCDELVDLLLRLQEDNAARVILLTDRDAPLDPSFDLKAVAEELARGKGQTMDTMAADLDTIRRVVTLMQETGKPIVAAVHGDVRDAGFGLLTAADIRLAAPTATFTPPDMRTGLMPDWGLTHFLPRLIGTGHTFELLWSGRTFTAEEAYRLGLVDRLLAVDTWDAELEAFCRRLATLPQPAVRLTKLVVQQADQFDMTSALSLEYEAQQQCWNSRETAAGLAAHLSGEDPDFTVAEGDNGD